MLVCDNLRPTRKFHDQEPDRCTFQIGGHCAEERKSALADAEIGSRVDYRTVFRIVMTAS
jgi:hypothetical protein